MKKYALILSGQPRFLERAFEQIKENILDKNPNIDVFFHCWYQEDGSMTGANWVQEDIADKFNRTIPFRLIKLYQPKGFLVEAQKHDLSLSNKKWEDYPLTNGENLAFVTHSMFYSAMKASELCHKYEEENGFKYDFVVKTRFDLGILSPLILDDYEPTKDSIYYADVCRNKSVIGDYLLWGTSKDMRKLCEVYNHIDEYVECGTTLCGEEMLTKHLNVLGYGKISVPISAFLVRDSHFNHPNPWGYQW